MGFSDHNYHHLLRQFEESNRDGNRLTARQFIDSFESPPSHAFVLDVVGIDIELELTNGRKPTPQTYVEDFPYLADEIPDLCASVVNTFVSNFCPVRHCFGSLKSTDAYDIEEEIGRGGMGVVYQAVQKSIGRRVALKVLFMAREDIFAEARRVAVLNHPNICKIYDAGMIGEFPFMSMQFVRGMSLKEKQLQGRLPMLDSVRIVTQIADALAEAHRSNLVHFDVKPDNIRVGPDGLATLMDFGLSKKRSDIALESNRVQPFSPVYSAPEQLSLQFGERSFSSDLYSLGLVLYELLTGRRAWQGDLKQIIDQMKHDPPRRLTDYVAGLPLELESICLKAIERRPEDRFSSMSDFRDLLKTFLLRY